MSKKVTVKPALHNRRNQEVWGKRWRFKWFCGVGS